MEILHGNGNTLVQYLKEKNLIPRVSIGLSGGDDPSCRLFGNFWPLWKRILIGSENKKKLQLEVYWHILTHTFQKIVPMTMAHSFVCIDGQTVMEAAGTKINFLLFKLPWGQIRKSRLQDFFGKDRWFSLYGNKNVSEENELKARYFSIGSEGVIYDLNMVRGFINVDQSKEYNEILAQNCTENTTKVARLLGVQFIDKLKDNKIHPMHIKEFCESGIDGWYKICDWNGTEQKLTVCF